MSRFAVPLLAVSVALAGCADAVFHPAPLPTLVHPEPPVKPLTAPAFALAAGEHFTYQVRLHGIAIGKLELEVSDAQVMSRFKTDELASAFANVQDELVTTLDRANRRAGASTESLVINSEAQTFNADATMNGNPGQTVHTALGLVRAWAKLDAAPGFIALVEAGKIWRIDLTRPTAEDLQGAHAIRVDGKIRADKPIALAMWFAASDDRTPLRFELTSPDFRVVADLIRE